MPEQPLVKLDEFRGVFANNDEDTVPPNHFKDGLNLAYGPGIFFSRPGIVDHLTIGDVRRIRVYNIPGEDDRLLILNGSGQLYDSTHLVAPILTIPLMTDFTSVSIFGRAYISPHDGDNGLEDEIIYVYDGADGSFVARPAAGQPPQGFDLVLTQVAVTPINTDIVAPVAPANGLQTLTTSPFVPNIPCAIKFTQTGGTVTAITITVVGKNPSQIVTTKVYVDKIFSAGPQTYVTGEIWAEITSITISGLAGSGGSFKVETTLNPPGKLEIGYHVVGVVYETVSGFLTKPGPENNLKAINIKAKNKAIKVEGIPADPGDEIEKVHIVISKFIKKKAYTGNPDPQLYEMFFVPENSGGFLDPGVTTTVVNVFDADLLDSADYLLDNLSEIPAGVCMLATSKGRLLIGGEFENNAIIRGSKGGEPESVSATDGFVICDPVTGGVKNLAEYRDSIYPVKSHATLITQDNGDLLSTWTINQIDRAIGTECHAIATILGREADTADAVIIGDRSGLHAFNGAYPDRPLSWKIKEIWDTISDSAFNKTEIAIDPVNKIILVVFQSEDAEDNLPGVQRVLNPGFESGDLTSWTPDDPINTTVIANPGGGSGAFVCELIDNGITPVQDIEQEFAIDDSETATISAAGATPENAPPAGIQRVINPGAEDGDLTGWSDAESDFPVTVIANPGSGSGAFVFALDETGENSSQLDQVITIDDSETATLSASGAGPVNTSSISFYAYAPDLDMYLHPDGSWSFEVSPTSWCTFTGSGTFSTQTLITTVPTGELTINLFMRTDGDIDNNGQLLADEYTWTVGETEESNLLFQAHAEDLDLWLNSSGDWVVDATEQTTWATHSGSVFGTHSLVTQAPAGETSIKIFATTEIVSGVGGSFYVDEYTWTTEGDETGTDSCIMADYSEGLNWQDIKWGAHWEFTNQDIETFFPETIITQFDPVIGKVVFRLGHRDADFIYSYQHGLPDVVEILDDDGQAIDHLWETYKYTASEAGAVTQLTGMRIKISGFGEGEISLIGSEGRPIENPANLTIPGSSNGNILQKFNFVSDDISIQVEISEFRSWFKVSNIWIFGDELWNERPSSSEFDLLLDMVESWELDEVSGNRTGIHAGLVLTDVNAVGSIAGVDGELSALFVRASAQSLQRTVGVGDILTVTNADFTISTWVYFTSLPTSDQIFQIVTWPVNEVELLFYFPIGFNPRFLFGYYSDVGITLHKVTTGTSPFATGTWYHVSARFTYASLLLELKINESATVTANGTLAPVSPSSGAPFRLAQDFTGTTVHALDGRMQYTRIWRRRLNEFEIEYLYNRGLGRAYEDING